MAHKMQFTCDRCGGTITDDLLKPDRNGELAQYNDCPAVKLLRPERAFGSEEVVYCKLILMNRSKQYMVPQRKDDLCRKCRAAIMREAADELEKNGAIQEKRPSDDDD